MNSEDHADDQWRSAIIRGAARHMARDFAVSALGVLTTIGTWVGAIWATITFGGWWWAAAAVYLTGYAIYAVIVGRKLRRHVKDATENGLHTLNDEANAKALDNPFTWKAAFTPAALTRCVLVVVPRAVATAALLATAVPAAAAIVAGVLLGTQPILFRLYPRNRTLDALKFLGTRRGPEGLPTPEI